LKFSFGSRQALAGDLLDRKGKTTMTTANDVLKAIKDDRIDFVDLRFTDLKGKLQHVTLDGSVVDESVFAEGVMFDGSSIAGWKAINESDMVLLPDPTTLHRDPFFAEPTLVVLCDVHDPVTTQPYNRDPRGTARKAETYLKSTGAGDIAYFGPEAEFFIFDDVRYKADPYNTGFKLDSSELPSNDDRIMDGGNLGHRPRVKGGYFPVPPVDSCQGLRSQMLKALAGMGVAVEKHHHEVAAGQHELGIRFDTLVRNADKMQLYKYAVHQVANAAGKAATFMPKPVHGDNGSGMHVHQSIWKNGRPAFAGNHYAGLSETCLHYIGGIIRHAKAINAFTNFIDEFLQASSPGIRSARVARLLRVQPLSLVPNSFRRRPESEARRGPFPRSVRQSLSWLRCDADGRARRHQEQGPSGRADG
jgi:glutamine synthetase